ncbi:hypothetical protein BJX70DRAFT_139164 [Aspergillus crustosus]
MRVNLDEIEFYRGPTRQPPSTSAKPTPAPAPRSFQHSSPTGFPFRPAACDASLGRGPPLTGPTYEWNVFDVEINNVYASTQSQMTHDVKPAVTRDIPAAFDILLDLKSSSLAFSEPAPSKDAPTPVSCPSGTDHLDPVPRDVQENELPDTLPDAKEAETPRLSCVPCVAVPAPEQASNASSSLSACGDSQEESAKPKPSVAGACYSNCIDPRYCENGTEPRHTSDLAENPYPRAIDASERAKDADTAEGNSTLSGLSRQPTRCSSPESSGARTMPIPDSPVRYPSIAVVVPAPSWKQDPIRTSTRAAAAVCNKRLRSSRGGGNHQELDASDIERPSQKRKKRRSATRHPSHFPSPSIPAPCHCSRDVYEVRGNALLTVKSDSGLKPAYYFTFVPDAALMPSPHIPADNSGKQRPYSSDENALLVRLKEREGMGWSEIAEHFPDRNASSLQVHYSTKLRHKASSRSGRQGQC